MAGARVTQEVSEVVRGGDPDARITQVATEVVRGGDPDARITQVAVEVLRGHGAIPAAVTGSPLMMMLTQ